MPESEPDVVTPIGDPDRVWPGDPTVTPTAPEEFPHLVRPVHDPDYFRQYFGNDPDSRRHYIGDDPDTMRRLRFGDDPDTMRRLRFGDDPDTMRRLFIGDRPDKTSGLLLIDPNPPLIWGDRETQKKLLYEWYLGQLEVRGWEIEPAHSEALKIISDLFKMDGVEFQQFKETIIKHTETSIKIFEQHVFIEGFEEAIRKTAKALGIQQYSVQYDELRQKLLRYDNGEPDEATYWLQRGDGGAGAPLAAKPSDYDILFKALKEEGFSNDDAGRLARELTTGGSEQYNTILKTTPTPQQLERKLKKIVSRRVTTGNPLPQPVVNTLLSTEFSNSIHQGISMAHAAEAKKSRPRTIYWIPEKIISAAIVAPYKRGEVVTPALFARDAGEYNSILKTTPAPQQLRTRVNTMISRWSATGRSLPRPVADVLLSDRFISGLHQRIETFFASEAQNTQLPVLHWIPNQVIAAAALDRISEERSLKLAFKAYSAMVSGARLKRYVEYTLGTKIDPNIISTPFLGTYGTYRRMVERMVELGGVNVKQALQLARLFHSSAAVADGRIVQGEAGSAIEKIVQPDVWSNINRSDPAQRKEIMQAIEALQNEFGISRTAAYRLLLIVAHDPRINIEYEFGQPKWGSLTHVERVPGNNRSYKIIASPRILGVSSIEDARRKASEFDGNWNRILGWTTALHL
ncbi:MAG: hypothetical protein ACYSSL_10810, partial [Planctomycetota bacterium]